VLPTDGDTAARTERDIAPTVGVVVIGRNEGERLRRCLDSVRTWNRPVVYVDSGSTDGSVALAGAMDARVVDLDLGKPFTAARARNAGFASLLVTAPHLKYVQFIDGDCEAIAGWLENAEAFLSCRADVAMVCGRLRERFPEASIYNRLCDMEWNRPPGETKACGGIAMVRADVFASQRGFREELIAGEEPELCVRVRAQGFKVWRIPIDMAWHDAAMLEFGQWWRRSARGGHAFAEGACLHGATPERHYVVETWRALLWGAVLPVAIVGLSLAHPAWLLLGLAYPLQMLRIALRLGIGEADQRWRAFFLVLARFPEAQGVLKFSVNRWRHRRTALIEYK
jgi:GT2 family glycosyltransferase